MQGKKVNSSDNYEVVEGTLPNEIQLLRSCREGLGSFPRIVIRGYSS